MRPRDSYFKIKFILNPASQRLDAHCCFNMKGENGGLLTQINTFEFDILYQGVVHALPFS